MTATRRWPYPDLRNGTTIHHLTDSHEGYRPQFTNNWQDRVAQDLDVLKVAHSGHIHTGDMVEIPTPDLEAQYKAWRTTIKSDGKPYVQVPGNHDLTTYSTGTPRDPDSWALSIGGMSSANTVTDIGDIRVIGITPVWSYSGGYVSSPLSAGTLSWLDTQLTAAGSRPVFLATHEPPVGAMGAGSAGVEPNSTLATMIGSYPCVKAWLSGHWHVNSATSTAVAQTMTFGGRTVAVINGPSASGLNGTDAPTHQWQRPATSLFVTYLGGSVEVRWRDHLERQWTTGAAGAVKSLIIPT